MRKRDLIAVVSDLRLTAEARIVVLDVALRGDGWHAIEEPHFAALLNHPGLRQLRSSIKLAEQSQWIVKRKGGGGKPNSYLFDRSQTERSGLFSDRSESEPSVRVSEDAETERSDLAQMMPNRNGLGSNHYESVGRTEDAQEASSESDRSSAASSEALARVPTGHRIGGGEGGERELSIRALEILFDNDVFFVGCRGAIRDYLIARVPDPTKQIGWLQTALMCLNDARPVFRWPDGTPIVSQTERARLMASAANDLLQTDESAMKGNEGEFRNLQTKLEILIKQEWEKLHEPDDTDASASTGGRNGSGRTGKASGSVGADATGYEHLS